MAAAAAALAMGVDARRGRGRACAGFEGVPHRLERVGELDGVLYVNDSKATNVAAAAAAILSFDGGVHAILGGSSKGESFEELADAGRRALRGLLPDRRDRRRARARSRAGLGGGRRAAPLRAASPTPSRAAARDAAPGEVVLLAPACASFDAYRDYEERGEHFRALVEALRMKRAESWPPVGPRRACRGAADRVLAAADGDALPGRLRRGHGLQRQLDDVAARRRRRQRLLPQAHRRSSASLGLLAMRILAVRGVQVIHRLTPVLLVVSIVLLVLVLVPGVGIEVNGAKRWLGAGLFQIQPSEIAKLALVLHGADAARDAAEDDAVDPAR